MAKMSTQDVSSVTMQQMIDAGLNAFALTLLIESYAPGDRAAPTVPLDFVFRGVRVRLEPYVDGVASTAEVIENLISEFTADAMNWAAIGKNELSDECFCVAKRLQDVAEEHGLIAAKEEKPPEEGSGDERRGS